MDKLINLIKKKMNEAMSPTPKKVEEKVDLNQMDFPKALKEVIEGKKITKLEWCNRAVYVSILNEHLTIYKDDGKPHDFIVRDSDIIGDDWVVIS